MDGFVIGVVGTLLSAGMWCLFFMYYQKKDFFCAGIGLVAAIAFLTCVVCAMWDYTLQVIM